MSYFGKSVKCPDDAPKTSTSLARGCTRNSLIADVRHPSPHSHLTWLYAHTPTPHLQIDRLTQPFIATMASGAWTSYFSDVTPVEHITGNLAVIAILGLFDVVVGSRVNPKVCAPTFLALSLSLPPLPCGAARRSYFLPSPLSRTTTTLSRLTHSSVSSLPLFPCMNAPTTPCVPDDALIVLQGVRQERDREMGRFAMCRIVFVSTAEGWSR